MIGRVIRLAVLAVAMAAVYVFFRPEADAVLAGVRDRWNVLRKDTAVAQVPTGTVSPRTAEQAEIKMGRLRDGSARETFTTNELQSLLQYRYQQTLPEYVRSPSIRLDRDHLEIRVRLPVDQLPGTEDLGQILMLLPDTTDLEMRGTLLPSDDGFVAFAVDALSAQRIPFPARLVPPVLSMFGREDVPGLPRDAIQVPLPEGAQTAYVRADSLVVLSTRVR